MRIVVVHPGVHFSVHDLYAGWVEALRAAGQDVFEFNLHDRLTFYSQVLLETETPGELKRALDPDQAIELAVNGLYATVLKVRPHVLMVVSGMFTPAHLMDVTRDAGVRVVLVCTESPYEDDRQVALAEHADLTLINDPTNLGMFPAGTQYFPHAYRPGLHSPGPVVPDYVCDLAFVGTGYPSRVAFLEQMDLSGLDVMLAGNWRLIDPTSPLWPHLAHEQLDNCDNDTAVEIYRSARCGLNLYRREASADHLSAGWAMGPREVEMAACGAFFLREPRGEGDEVLDMLPTFTGPEDASEQVRYWLAHDTERATLASKAREAVADRTFDHHAARLLRLLGR